MSIAAPPQVIQGGMGVGVSSWKLARAVAKCGQLGVVSGTALDAVLARRLQDGDPAGDMRRALAQFPVPEMATRILDRYFQPGGRGPGRPYRPVPKLTLRPSRAGQELAIVATSRRSGWPRRGIADRSASTTWRRSRWPRRPPRSARCWPAWTWF